MGKQPEPQGDCIAPVNPPLNERAEKQSNAIALAGTMGVNLPLLNLSAPTGAVVWRHRSGFTVDPAAHLYGCFPTIVTAPPEVPAAKSQSRAPTAALP